MKHYLFLLLLIAGFFSGCSSKISQEEIDGLKSCRALNFEYKNIEEEISKIDPKQEKEVSFFHYGVVTAGALDSLLLITTGTFYVLPALTITYYNIFIGYDEKMEKLEYLRTREKIISSRLRSKHCKTTN